MKKFFIAFMLLAGIHVYAQKNDSTVALIKQNLATSSKNLKTYEWIETMTVFVKGEQKSKKQNRCYYDVSGKLVKVATGGGSPEEKKKGGLRGKIAENKKEDIQEYIKACAEKVQAYLPPDPAKIQQIFSAGKAVVHVIEPNAKVKLDFPDYLQQGDMISIGVDNVKKQLMSISVASYLSKKEDKVDFDVKYQSLPDGTQYSSAVTLQAPAKEVKIVIENSGYKKANP